MKKIALLGATGSIGIQTIEVIRAHREAFDLHSMAFGTNLEVALPLIKEFQPRRIAVATEEIKEALASYVDRAKIVVGVAGLIELSTDDQVDLVVNAVMGRIGLEPTIEAIKAKKTIALANKETLVIAGHLVMALAKQHGVNILPVDSEHSAIFQCLQGEDTAKLERLIITASGGSFRDLSRDQLRNVTIADALNHPNWSMGAKITIDSATMMNKGLEVIEAHWLFDIEYDKIDVILHKESTIHSMVEFVDRSVIAQLGYADMRVPIQYALSYPNRLPLKKAKSLNLVELGKLHFEKMDFDRFPCLRMAYHAGKTGGSMPTVLNAANEQAVGLFLKEQIPFLDIERLVEQVMAEHDSIVAPDLATIHALDVEIRRKVIEHVNC
ncbi:1-deoxy-D-xylulose-5-phosphate reductoisomerase [Amphibacillus sediminis]|uniref:1-deoxy-D-xylulose-5-phosphate reductoisomerase n=1 Tax=Amphibacillus sediminis TaxID=360185 RepID=UPI0008343701|nr:1-deoxy-D-xylulose-5-phosphate reductoisomerase [Amphibacillus sediminis]